MKVSKQYSAHNGFASKNVSTSHSGTHSVTHWLTDFGDFLLLNEIIVFLGTRVSTTNIYNNYRVSALVHENCMPKLPCNIFPPLVRSGWLLIQALGVPPLQQELGQEGLLPLICTMRSGFLPKELVRAAKVELILGQIWTGCRWFFFFLCWMLMLPIYEPLWVHTTYIGNRWKLWTGVVFKCAGKIVYSCGVWIGNYYHATASPCILSVSFYACIRTCTFDTW